MNLKTNINELKGIGEKTEKLFWKIGIRTVEDLINYYPAGYDIYEDPIPIQQVEKGKTCTIKGEIVGRVKVSSNYKNQIVIANVRDTSGTISVQWFRMPFLRNTLPTGEPIILRGQIVEKNKALWMTHPEIFHPCEKYGDKVHSLQPKYRLTAGLTNNSIIKTVKQALDQLDLTKDKLPQEIRKEYELSEYNYAVRGIHFPTHKDVYYHARRRLVFDEFLSFILSIRELKEKNAVKKNEYRIPESEQVESFITSLPFALTNAQKKVWSEIKEDLAGEECMSRLIQGDVGSGKTIIAILALMTVSYEGYQTAMMAPTEVLAKQHYDSIQSLFQQYKIPFTPVLLTGSMTAKEKRQAYEKIASGEANIIIGTHALFQNKVEYKNLALVITDEQHRFGVCQREVFSEKGKNPHVLVMSATPIPRTLAIIIYGDLDISVIDELPANRLPIKNCVVDDSYRTTAHNFIQKQVEAGRQCYIICPMIEENDQMELENVIDYAENLKHEFGSSIQVSYLHGKMKQQEKDKIMEDFSKNKIQVLVSTTVIEVGINVPNATVMLVENAERFGLAQLHQLRGRVGRGKEQSYCIFISSSKSKDTKKRLEILNKSNDGFKIASEDLKLRGPGDLFGIRQSGLLQFQLADVFQDGKELQLANRAADKIIQKYPETIGELIRIEKDNNIVL